MIHISVVHDKILEKRGQRIIYGFRTALKLNIRVFLFPQSIEKYLNTPKSRIYEKRSSNLIDKFDPVF